MKQLFASTALAMLLAGGLAAAPASAAQPATQLIATLPGEALPISDFYNQNVYDNRDNKIGEVNDLLLDSSGKVNAVIFNAGMVSHHPKTEQGKCRHQQTLVPPPAAAQRPGAPTTRAEVFIRKT